MREQYEEAISILTDAVNNYIGHEEVEYGECEQHQEIMEALELISKLAIIGANMTEITEQEMMDVLDELIKAGKVRSFLKPNGDPANMDDWLYEAIKSVD